MSDAVDKLHGADHAPSPAQCERGGNHPRPPEAPDEQRGEVGFAQRHQVIALHAGPDADPDHGEPHDGNKGAGLQRNRKGGPPDQDAEGFPSEKIKVELRCHPHFLFSICDVQRGTKQARRIAHGPHSRGEKEQRFLFSVS